MSIVLKDPKASCDDAFYGVLSMIDMSLHFLLRGSEAASHSSIRRSCFDSSSVARYISGSGHERETRRDASR